MVGMGTPLAIWVECERRGTKGFILKGLIFTVTVLFSLLAGATPASQPELDALADQVDADIESVSQCGKFNNPSGGAAAVFAQLLGQLWAKDSLKQEIWETYLTPIVEVSLAQETATRAPSSLEEAGIVRLTGGQNAIFAQNDDYESLIIRIKTDRMFTKCPDKTAAMMVSINTYLAAATRR